MNESMVGDRLQEIDHTIYVQRLPVATGSGEVVIFCHAGIDCTAVWQIVAKAGDGFTAQKIRLCQKHFNEHESSMRFLAKFEHRQ